MKEMKIVFGAVILGIVAGFAFSTAYACECVVASPSKKLHKARVVFVGEVVEIGLNTGSEWATQYVKFKVERQWKGVKEQYVTVVGAPGAAGACGLPVQLNRKYLIYAFKMENQLETSFCSSRSVENAKEDLSVIGEGQVFRPKT